MDIEKIKKAVREYNAANNSLNRAMQDLVEACPEYITVLHRCKPGEDLFWSYRCGDGRITWGVDREHDVPTKAVIIEAPGPNDEFLPRLEQ